MIDTLWQDLKYAARSLRRTPGFTVAAIVTLALGIGANATIFTLLDAVLFKPLPVSRPGELSPCTRMRRMPRPTRCRTPTAARDGICGSRIRDSCGCSKRWATTDNWPGPRCRPIRRSPAGHTTSLGDHDAAGLGPLLLDARRRDATRPSLRRGRHAARRARQRGGDQRWVLEERAWPHRTGPRADDRDQRRGADDRRHRRAEFVGVRTDSVADSGYR